VALKGGHLSPQPGGGFQAREGNQRRGQGKGSKETEEMGIVLTTKSLPFDRLRRGEGSDMARKQDGGKQRDG